MLIDIHRHSTYKGHAIKCIRNLFHNQLSEAGAGEYYSAGLHPWHVQETTLKKDLEMIHLAAINPQIIAIGETGLDKSIVAPIEIQLQAFESQMEIAHEVNKPMIIHCVRAYNEIYELKIKSGHQQPWLIHWFNTNEQMGRQLISKGFYLSFGHMLFHDESRAYKAFPNLPLEYIFFETDDAGYAIDEVYQRASDLLLIPLLKLEKKIEQNFENFFGFKP
jgi:TatD DNase family protein